MAVLAFIREILRLNNQLGSDAAKASPFGGAFSALHREFATLGAEVTMRFDHEFVIAQEWGAFVRRGLEFPSLHRLALFMSLRP
jgi:hypothetical protein